MMDQMNKYNLIIFFFFVCIFSFTMTSYLLEIYVYPHQHSDQCVIGIFVANCSKLFNYSMNLTEETKMDENKPFEAKYTAYNSINNIEEIKQDVITLKLNPEERKQLELNKVALQQEKDGTAIKQLMNIATKVIHETPEGLYFKTVLENMRKNKRLGIVEVEPKI